MTQSNLSALFHLLINKRLKHDNYSNSFESLFKGDEADDFRTNFIILKEKQGISGDDMISLCKFIRNYSTRIPIHVPHLVDNCGTGGDKLKTFNISTASAFVAAGAGAYVAKHGNRSSSSKFGSSDLMEILGININVPSSRMVECLKKYRFGYFHAPLYYPMFKKLVFLRRALGIRTLFNQIGPLLNPLSPKRQLIGVSSRQLLANMLFAVKKLRYKHCIVLLGTEGLDEIAPIGKTLGYEIKKNSIFKFEINPSRYGIKKARLRDLQVSTLKDSAEIILTVFKGRTKGPTYDTIVLNAGFTLYVSGFSKTPLEGIDMARECIKQRVSYRVLNRVKDFLAMAT